jgi:hypothetical protein
VDVVPHNLDELYFERGGPLQRAAQRLFAHCGASHSLGARIVGFLAVTWFPLVVLAALEGRALGASPQESLLLDFGTYARFFLGVPLLLAAERIVGPHLRSAGSQFVQGGFVRQDDYPFSKTLGLKLGYVGVRTQAPVGADSDSFVMGLTLFW